jgi:hypothetical protein
MPSDERRVCSRCKHYHKAVHLDINLPGSQPEIMQLRLEWRQKVEEIALKEEDNARINQGYLYPNEPRTLDWCGHHTCDAENPVTGDKVKQYAICKFFNTRENCAGFSVIEE